MGVENLAQENNNFETQFNKIESLDLAGRKIEVVDVSPEKLTDEVPVIMVPGMGADIPVYKDVLGVMVEKNRRAIAYNHSNQGGDLESEATKEEIEIFPKEILRLAYDLLNIIKQKNLSQVDIIAHSEGAMTAIIAAVIHPEKFRNIVLFAPAGLIGKDNIVDLTKRFILKQLLVGRGKSLDKTPITEEENKTKKTILKSVIKYILKNPLYAAKESFEISKFQINDLISYLHEKGIGIVVMSGVDDPVFPAYKLQKLLKSKAIDGFLTMQGAHNAITDQKYHIIWAEKMLTALKNKKDKKTKFYTPNLLQEFK